MLKLYTTSHCHLCETALELTLQVCNKDQIHLVEIVDDDSLLTKYGARIPVLQRIDTLIELDWPFGYDDIQNLINT